MEPPLTAGIVDGSVKLRGTMYEPTLDVDVQAHGLAKDKIDKIDVCWRRSTTPTRRRG